MSNELEYARVAAEMADTGNGDWQAAQVLAIIALAEAVQYQAVLLKRIADVLESNTSTVKAVTAFNVRSASW